VQGLIAWFMHCADLKDAQCSTFRWGQLDERAFNMPPKDGYTYNYDNNPLLQQHSR